MDKTLRVRQGRFARKTARIVVMGLAIAGAVALNTVALDSNNLVHASSGSVTQLTFSGIATAGVDTRSSQMTVTFRDSQGEASAIGTAGTLTLETDSPTGRFIFTSDKAGDQKSSPATTTIKSNWSRKNFFYSDSSPGAHTLKAILKVGDNQSISASSQFIVIEPISNDATSTADVSVDLAANTTTAIPGTKDYIVVGTAVGASRVDACFYRQPGGQVTTLSLDSGERTCLNAPVQSSGAWRVNVPAGTLSAGGYHLEITALTADATVLGVVERNVIVDTVSPIVVLSLPTTDPTADAPILIQGLVVNFADLQSLYVYAGGTRISDNLVGMISPKGEWSYELTKGLNKGVYTMSVVATDKAGNQSDPVTSPYASWPLTVAGYQPMPSVQSGTDPFIAPLPPLVVESTPSAVGTQLHVVGSSPSSVMDSAKTSPDTAVLGAETTHDAGRTKDLASTNIAAPASLMTSRSGWRLFGLAWYWWLTVVAVGTGAWLTLAAMVRRYKAGKARP